MWLEVEMHDEATGHREGHLPNIGPRGQSRTNLVGSQVIISAKRRSTEARGSSEPIAIIEELREQCQTPERESDTIRDVTLLQGIKSLGTLRPSSPSIFADITNRYSMKLTSSTDD